MSKTRSTILFILLLSLFSNFASVGFAKYYDSQINIAISNIKDAGDMIKDLDHGVFKKSKDQNNLIENLDKAIQYLEKEKYEKALNILTEDILRRLDGCALHEKPDGNDFITDCTVQAQIYPLIKYAVELIQGLVDYDDGTNKVTICHYPPENPYNPQTITISEKALKAHLAHGDTLGPCDKGNYDIDNDNDGYTENEGDCDDADAAVNPGATEIPYNGKDDDCNPDTWDDDLDGDGHGIATDCDDNNPYVNPGVIEVCDGIDNNCDGQIDEGVKITYYEDSDGDGYGNVDVSKEACEQPTGYLIDRTDCDDTDNLIHPGAIEVCDGVDNNCDGQVDEGVTITYYADTDSDGYGDPNNTTQACTLPVGYTTDNTDCDDTDPAVHPGASEIPYNGRDDDCNPSTPDDDLDGDTYLKIQDCDDTNPNIYPGATEVPYDGIDQDCNGSDLNDMDGDGFAAKEAGGDDCNDDDDAIYPGAEEVCDEVDNNCDGLVDEGLKITFYRDLDGDGYGNPNESTEACAQPSGCVADNTDCDDNNAGIHPGATEIINNGIDEDCDGSDLVINYEPTATISASPGIITEGETATLSWNSTNATGAEIDQGIGTVTLNGSLEVSPAQTTTYTIMATGDGGTAIAFITITVNPAIPLPPDPSAVAPPIDRTAATSHGLATSFLYTGDNPIQTGVEAETITEYRCAVLRGKVLNRNNHPLPGVTISILAHPEFGQTLSRADGMFDMAVNGGSLLTVAYYKNGYLPVQRQVDAPWEDYAWLPDVVMIQTDTNVTTIDLVSGDPMQVAQGTKVSDNDGSRTATVLFPQGTSAEMMLPDGTTQPLTTLNVRATEYTVGENGPKAMPAPLPPQSGYTYCVDLTVDEAEAAGAADVRFSQPVYFYVENFLDFPVGMAVPTGYYDRKKGVWIPSDNGIIIRIIGITGGLADVDTDGDNTADNTGLHSAEREKLAILYQPDQSLWRVPITHFTPWDCNWPYGPPWDAAPPKQKPPMIRDKRDSDTGCGSIIGIQKQSLGEAVGIIGTPFSLHYHSNRTPGHRADYSLNIPLSGTTIPGSLKSILLEVTVTGRKVIMSFAPAPNLTHTFTWNGMDAYGRKMQGRHPIRVDIGYTYQAVYLEPADFDQSFAAFSGIPITNSRARQEITMWQKWKGTIGGWDNRGTGLGGWTMNIQHFYDPLDNTIWYGDGRSHSARYSFGNIITTFAGNGNFNFSGDGGPATQATLFEPFDVAVDGDGSLYIVDTMNNRIRRVGTDGIITTVAGKGNFYSEFSGDGGPAIQAGLSFPTSVAVGSDGSIYIADTGNNRIRRVGADGIITTVAGNGDWDFSGDGGPAIQASLNSPTSVAVSGDGSIYFVDTYNSRIRRVSADGIITTVAGNGNWDFSGDGDPAIEAGLGSISSVAVSGDGGFYISDTNNNLIRRVGTDGIITTVIGGNTTGGFSGDGGPATEARLHYPNGVKADGNGSIYFADTYNSRIRRVGTDGIITTVAGNGDISYSGDGGPATQAGLNRPLGVAVGGDGSLYIADRYNHRIRKIPSSSSQTGVGEYEIALPSEDGSEVYIFEVTFGRHLRTLNAYTNAQVFGFQYNSKGYLTRVTDGDGNVTTIERDANGNPTSIVAPFGQRTTLELNAGGYFAEITNPAGEPIQFDYTSDGLLTSLTDSLGNAKSYTYDAMGRLTKDEDPVGGFTALNRTESGNDYEVRKTTAEGRISTFEVEHLSTGDERRTNSFCCGTPVVTVTGTDGTTKTTYPDGMTVSILEGPDPRFSMQSPLLQSTTITTPDGLVYSTTRTRSVTLSDPNDQLSLLTQTDTRTINGRVYTDVYNATERTLTTTTPMGRLATATVDEQGRIRNVEVSGLAPVSFNYDSYGRPFTITQGTGSSARITTLSYNSEGYLDNRSNPLSQDTSFAYDQAGRTTQIVKADLKEITLGYDANGNRTVVTPPDTPDHTFSYTAVSLEETYNPPFLGTVSTPTQYEYNRDKQLLRTIRPDGKTLWFEYDSKGKLDLVTLPDSTTIGYTYDDATGQLTTITARGGERVSYSYDGSLSLGTAWSGTITGSVSRTYNNNIWITSHRVNGGSAITYQYDNDGLLTGAGNLVIGRNAQNGLVTGTTLGSVNDTLGYNTFGEVIDYRSSYNGSENFSTQFTRNKLGRIIEKTETVDGTTHLYTYAYDATGRLISVKKDNVIISAYTYDSNGNRLSHNLTTGTYDAQDRLITYGNTSYTYTANGELHTRTDALTNETCTYTYDVLGNLVSVNLPDGTQIEYVIDGRNRRIGKKVNGTLVQGFLYQDYLKPIVELDGSNGMVSRFVYAGGVNAPAYMIRNGVTYRLIKDHLGSPRLVVNTSTGQIIQRMDYDEFGNVTNDTNPGFQPFGFAGGIYDKDTGLVRFGARDYDAGTGRWTAKDPIGFNGGSTNLYSYVDNDPTNFTDPTGLQFDGEVDLEMSVEPGEMNGQSLASGMDFLRGGDLWLDPISTMELDQGQCLKKRVLDIYPDPNILFPSIWTWLIELTGGQSLYPGRGGNVGGPRG